MAKKPKPKSTEEDADQSERFIKAAKDLEAAGELHLTEGEKALENLVGKMARQKGRPG